MTTKQSTRNGYSVRKLIPAKPTRKRRSAKTVDKADLTYFLDILGSFADSRAVIETVYRSFENTDDCVEGTSTLRIGLNMFNDAYNELDMAINRLPGL